MFATIHRSLHKMIELTSQLVDLEHTLKLHKRIYRAIRRRDPDQSRRRMVEHLLDAKQLLMRANEHQLKSHLQDRIHVLAMKSKDVTQSKMKALDS